MCGKLAICTLELITFAKNKQTTERLCRDAVMAGPRGVCLSFFFVCLWFVVCGSSSTTYFAKNWMRLQHTSEHWTQLTSFFFQWTAAAVEEYKPASYRLRHRGKLLSRLLYLCLLLQSSSRQRVGDRLAAVFWYWCAYWYLMNYFISTMWGHGIYSICPLFVHLY